VALKGLRTALTDSLARSDHKAAISLLVQFGDLIDRFFDAVLVNCDDLQLRSNRHSLLNLVKQEFLRVADISKIVIESE
jgi:glycyl-tRNA synthetase beta chain